MDHSLRFVISVDDAGPRQSREVERRSIGFFNDCGVPASFFVIPCSTDGEQQLTDDPEWVSRARGYERDGFDYHLHGYRHIGFEFGPPESWMVQICGPKAVESESRGFPDMRPDWTDQELRRKFGIATAAFEAAFEHPALSFRAGCLAAQADAFRIMPEFGIRYDCNKIIDPRAWDFIAGKLDTPRRWDDSVLPYPYQLTPDVVELPCMAEYFWQLKPDTAQAFQDLALEDLDRAAKESGLFMVMCHQQEVGGESELPRQVLRAVIEAARERYNPRFETITDLIGEIEAGAVPVGRPLTG